ncbi:MAG: hypothetical protein MJ245_01385 [Clostridia bacterium]|nr:hypothetical protein [Clostridia bacterium]
MQSLTLSIIFVIISIILAVFGILKLKKGYEIQNEYTEKVVGVITKVYSTQGKNGKKKYYPIFSFEYKGKEYIGEIGLSSSNPNHFKLKTEHKIMFNPRRPGSFVDAEINPDKLIGLMSIFIALLLFLTAFGIKIFG